MRRVNSKGRASRSAVRISCRTPSGGCCRLLGGAYSDFSEFSRNIAFLVRGERPDLRDAFDYGLDMAQKSGTTQKIFNAYVPLNPW